MPFKFEMAVATDTYTFQVHANPLVGKQMGIGLRRSVPGDNPLVGKRELIGPR